MDSLVKSENLQWDKVGREDQSTTTFFLLRSVPVCLVYKVTLIHSVVVCTDESSVAKHMKNIANHWNLSAALSGWKRECSFSYPTTNQGCLPRTITLPLFEDRCCSVFCEMKVCILCVETTDAGSLDATVQLQTILYKDVASSLLMVTQLSFKLEIFIPACIPKGQTGINSDCAIQMYADHRHTTMQSKARCN